jgi:hypothetical protein
MSRSWLSRNVLPIAGAAAVLCGLLFLQQTGAPPRLLLLNLAALGIAVAVLAIVRLVPLSGTAARRILLLLAATALLATALFGATAEGATRWVLVGGLSLQPSLILVPVLLLAHVSKSDGWSSAAVALSALAMALQPDRSIAAVIAAVVLVDAGFRRTAAAWLLAAACSAAFAATLLQPDHLPAVAHVDQLLWTSFAAEPLAATAIWAGTLLLFVPAGALWRGGQRAEAAAFAALWSILVASALLGNYPTPLVGYGASAILGYLLAALAWPALSGASSKAAAFARHPTTLPGLPRVAHSSL